MFWVCQRVLWLCLGNLHRYEFKPTTKDTLNPIFKFSLPQLNFDLNLHSHRIGGKQSQTILGLPWVMPLLLGLDWQFQELCYWSADHMGHSCSKKLSLSTRAIQFCQSPVLSDPLLRQSFLWLYFWGVFLFLFFGKVACDLNPSVISLGLWLSSEPQGFKHWSPQPVKILFKTDANFISWNCSHLALEFTFWLKKKTMLNNYSLIVTQFYAFYA